MSVLKYLRGKQLLGQPLWAPTASGPQQFAGRTALNSGSATVTVSTNVVEADSIILLTPQAHTNAVSGYLPLDVRTISPGNFFTVGHADGAAKARDVTVMWMMIKS